VGRGIRPWGGWGKAEMGSKKKKKEKKTGVTKAMKSARGRWSKEKKSQTKHE